MQPSTHTFAVSCIDANTKHSPYIDTLKKLLAAQGIACDSSQRVLHPIVLIACREQQLSDNAMQRINDALAADCRILVLNYLHSFSDEYKWSLMRLGIHDIIDVDDKNIPLHTICSRVDRWMAIEEVLQSPAVRESIIGSSRRWKNFLHRVTEVACFTSSTVLLNGESGTGKEVTASLIHALDQRKHKNDLVLLDCSTIVPELSGSEFYGHERGAFTNAIHTREGAFALANGGTLFLDEIGEIPLGLQAGLLRVIQEGMYKPVGGNVWNKTHFRLVCATNRELQQEIQHGRFRQDLYFRIAAAVCTLPSLSERREDIPDLVRYFLCSELHTNTPPPVDTVVMNYLLRRDYPGNIRELKQLVIRMLTRYTGEGSITIGHLPEEEFASNVQLSGGAVQQLMEDAIRLSLAGGKDLTQIQDDLSFIALNVALNDSDNRLNLAAKKLNRSVRNLQQIRDKKEAR